MGDKGMKENKKGSEGKDDEDGRAIEVRELSDGMDGMGGSHMIMKDTTQHLDLWKTKNRSGFIVQLTDKPGQLAKVL